MKHFPKNIFLKNHFSIQNIQMLLHYWIDFVPIFWLFMAMFGYFRKIIYPCCIYKKEARYSMHTNVLSIQFFFWYRLSSFGSIFVFYQITIDQLKSPSPPNQKFYIVWQFFIACEQVYTKLLVERNTTYSIL